MSNPQPHDRPSSIIDTIKTPMGFFVLVVVVLEVIIGTIVRRSTEVDATVAVVGMLAVLVLLIGVVTFCAIKRPYVLLSGAAERELHEFCQRVAGHWWSKREDAPECIGFVTLRYDRAVGTLTLKGQSYDSNGRVDAHWESTASCVHAPKEKLYYYWTGRHKPTEAFEGFGEISFYVSDDGVNSGNGLFSDTNLANATSTTRKSSDFRRCTDEEAKVMLERDAERRVALLQEKLRMDLNDPPQQPHRG